MNIFEPALMTQILKVTSSILDRYFYYDDRDINSFLHYFGNRILGELEIFVQCVEPEILDELVNDKESRFHFTCYFTSAHLRESLIKKLHFTDQELQAFERILPKYTGERRYDKPKCKGTNNREFFE